MSFPIVGTEVAEFVAALYYLALWLAPFAVAGTVEWVQERHAKHEQSTRSALHVVEGSGTTDREKEAA